MAIKTSTISVTSAATLLVSAAKGSNTDPVAVTIYAAATGLIIGGVGVTLTTGIPIPATTATSLVLSVGDDLYGIHATSVNVNVMTGRS
jgi:hypothetical protein